MISTTISLVSTGVLGGGGLLLLFASDVLLPRLAPGYPPSAAWVGQLVAAAWLGVAFLNWNFRASLLGGIYGRPLVLVNLLLYAIGGLAMWKAPGPSVLQGLGTVLLALASAYGVVLMRGPFDPLSKNTPVRS